MEESSTCGDFRGIRVSVYTLLHGTSIITRKGVHKSDINYRENMKIGQ